MKKERDGSFAFSTASIRKRRNRSKSRPIHFFPLYTPIFFQFSSGGNFFFISDVDQRHLQVGADICVRSVRYPTRLVPMREKLESIFPRDIGLVIGPSRKTDEGGFISDEDSSSRSSNVHGQVVALV